MQETFEKVKEIFESFNELGEENVLARIYSYFYNGLLYVISGDQYLKNGEYSKAEKEYEEGHKLLVRARASRGREGDEIHKEMVRWEYYANGMKLLSEALVSQNVEESVTFIQQAIKVFKQYSKLCAEKGLFYKIIAESRLFFAQYMLHKNYVAQAKGKPSWYKKELLRAITELKKANFVFHFYLDELEYLQNELDEITKQRIVSRAEYFWNKGSEQIVFSNFSKAQKYFAIASRYYVRASEICADFLEQRLYLALSKITLASQFESKANELYKRLDKPEEASKLFEQSFKIVDDAIGLLLTINSEKLIQSMTAQRSFYEALMFQTKGIALFDKEDFKASLDLFDKAMQKYNETQQMATEAKLDQLLEFLKQYKSELEGYIAMAKAML